MTVLQTGALPLGYRTIFNNMQKNFKNDSNGNRTRVTAVKGRCLNRLTMEPHLPFRLPLHHTRDALCILSDFCNLCKYFFIFTFAFLSSALCFQLFVFSSLSSAFCFQLTLPHFITSALPARCCRQSTLMSSYAAFPVPSPLSSPSPVPRYPASSSAISGIVFFRKISRSPTSFMVCR